MRCTCRRTTPWLPRSVSRQTGTRRLSCTVGTITDPRVRTLPVLWRRRDIPTFASTLRARRTGAKRGCRSSAPSLSHPRADCLALPGLRARSFAALSMTEATSVRRFLFPFGQLSAEPVSDLYQEGVVGMQFEELIVFLAPAPVARVWNEGFAPVRPDDEHRRPRTIFPSQHGV